MLQAPKKSSLSRAYSLVEVCIVLLIISVLVMVSVPSFYAFHEQLALAELHKLYTFIQVCSYRAMATNTNQKICFNIKDNSYQCAGYNEQLSPDVAFGAGIDVCGPPSHPHKPIAKPISLPNCSLILYPDGTMQSGSIYLTNKKK